MDFDLNIINKTDIVLKEKFIGLGKKNIINNIDCIDCNNCEQNGKWVPDSGIKNDCNCDCTRNCDYDCDCNCDCDCDCNCYDNNCYIDDDEDNWYPGGWDALCGKSDCDCNCDCDW